MKYENLKKYREKNKYTIKELSTKIKVSEKTIKSWEDGTLEPSMKYIKKISQLYKVPISVFIDGDKMLSDISKTMHTNLILTGFVFVFIIVILLLCSIVNNIEKYKEMDIYNFSGESENFKFDVGTLILSKNNKYIDLSGFDIKNDLKLKSATINIAFNEILWVADEYENNSVSINDWFKKIRYREYTKNDDLLNKTDKPDSFSKYKTDFPYDFKVEVNYCTIDDTCNVEILSIKSQKLNTTNKVVK